MSRLDITTLPDRYQRQIAAQIPPRDRSAPAATVAPGKKAKPRLRQSCKPLMNKLEQAFEQYLKFHYPAARIHPQAFHLGIANGTRYTPDFVTYQPLDGGRLCFWEVKGPKMFDGSGEKLKMAATKYPWAVFYLAWKNGGGEWELQLIRPEREDDGA